MQKHRIALSTVLLVLGLGILTPQFAQDTAIKHQKPDPDRTFQILGLVRTINTAEVADFSAYGSFESWQTLLAHQSEYFNRWLAHFYPQEIRFGDPPEILPGLNLRLNVHADGKGFDILLEGVCDFSIL